MAATYGDFAGPTYATFGLTYGDFGATAPVVASVPGTATLGISAAHATLGAASTGGATLTATATGRATVTVA